MRSLFVPPYRLTALPPYRLTALPPYRLTALPPYRLTALPPYRRTAVPPFRLPQPRGPPHPARVAVQVGQQPCHHRVREDVPRQHLRHRLGQPRQVRHPAAQHHRVRIESVDDRGQRPRQAILVPLQRLAGHHLAVVGGPGDLLARPARARRALVIPLEAGTRHEGLDATVQAAVARPCLAALLVGHPREWVVPPLAGDL